MNEFDSTLLNYYALYLTIKSDKKNAPDLWIFRNKELEKKRMKELDEIYARGERPPLAEQFSNKKHKKNKNIFGNDKNKKITKITNKVTGDVMEFQSIKEASRFLSLTEGDKTACAYEHILHTRKKYKNYSFEVNGGCLKPIKNIPKSVVAENIVTGEKIEFESTNKCAKYFKNIYSEIYRTKIKSFIEESKVYKNWKFYYEEEST